MSIRHPLVALALVAVCAAYTPWAQADPVTRASVEAALSGFEEGPRPEVVRPWGDAGVRALLEVGRDTSLAPGIRARAFRALGVFASDASVHAQLALTAATESEGLFVRRACFDALVEGFGDVQAVARQLASPDALVRDGAAWALRLTRDPRAREAMAQRLAVETDETVRRTLSAGLQAPVVAGAGAPPVVAPTVQMTTPTRAPRSMRRR